MGRCGLGVVYQFVGTFPTGSASLLATASPMFSTDAMQPANPRRAIRGDEVREVGKLPHLVADLIRPFTTDARTLVG